MFFRPTCSGNAMGAFPLLFQHAGIILILVTAPRHFIEYWFQSHWIYNPKYQQAKKYTFCCSVYNGFDKVTLMVLSFVVLILDHLLLLLRMITAAVNDAVPPSTATVITHPTKSFNLICFFAKLVVALRWVSSFFYFNTQASLFRILVSPILYLSCQTITDSARSCRIHILSVSSWVTKKIHTGWISIHHVMWNAHCGYDHIM